MNNPLLFRSAIEVFVIYEKPLPNYFLHPQHINLILQIIKTLSQETRINTIYLNYLAVCLLNIKTAQKELCEILIMFHKYLNIQDLIDIWQQLDSDTIVDMVNSLIEINTAEQTVIIKQLINRPPSKRINSALFNSNYQLELKRDWIKTIYIPI